MFRKQFFIAISSNRYNKRGNSIKHLKIWHGSNLLHVHMKTPHFLKTKIMKISEMINLLEEDDKFSHLVGWLVVFGLTAF